MKAYRNSNSNLEKHFLAILGCILAFSILHFAFRYVFRISDSGTSEGYRDTPILLSSLKDIAMLTFLLSTVLVISIQRSVVKFKIVNVIFSLMLINFVLALFYLSAVKYLISGDREIIVYARTLWLPIVILIPILIFKFDYGSLIWNWVKIMTYPLILFWLMTIFFYVLKSRLPGLSYIGSPRFGGILDDPNGYGVICVVFIAIFLSRGKYFLSAIFALNVVLTVSLSSYICLAIFFICIFIRQIASSSGKALMRSLTIGASSIFLLLCFYIVNSKSILVWWSEKSRSVMARPDGIQSALGTLRDYSLSEWMIGTKGFTESQITLTLLNSGLLGVLFQSILALILVFLCLKSRNLMIQNIGFWGTAVLISSFFVPFLFVYPVSILFWGFLGMAAVSSFGVTPAKIWRLGN